MDIDTLLERWSVLAPGLWENSKGPLNWFAVCNDDDGIVAYFACKPDAFRFRLAEINRQLNG